MRLVICVTSFAIIVKCETLESFTWVVEVLCETCDMCHKLCDLQCLVDFKRVFGGECKVEMLQIVLSQNYFVLVLSEIHSCAAVRSVLPDWLGQHAKSQFVCI